MNPATATLVKRCRAQLLTLGWDHPFFLIPSAKCAIRGDASIPTMAVDAQGVIYINPKFAASLSDAELRFVLAHELLHLLMLHFERRGERKPFRWNCAADRAINHALRSSIARTARYLANGRQEGIPEGVLFPAPSQEHMTAEELYELEADQQAAKGGEGNGTNGNGPGDVAPGKGCGTVPTRGTPGAEGQPSTLPGEGDAPRVKATTAQAAAREWRQIAATARAQARGAGSGARTDALIGVTELPPARVRWAQVLRGSLSRVIATRGRDDVSWARRNRRSHGGDFILPGGVTLHAQIAVAIDTSGSVGDASLAHAVVETVAMARAAGVKLFLVTHDTQVQWQGWVTPDVKPAQITATLKGRGGTYFEPAYEAIAAARASFDQFVHLTDGVPDDRWPGKPRNTRKLVVALIGCKSRHGIPTGAQVIDAEI